MVLEGTQAVAQTLSPAKLAHLVLLTRDLPRMRDWYETVLQAPVTVQDPMLCFLSYDEEHHRIALAGMPDLPPRAAGWATSHGFHLSQPRRSASHV